MAEPDDDAAFHVVFDTGAEALLLANAEGIVQRAKIRSPEF